MNSSSIEKYMCQSLDHFFLHCEFSTRLWCNFLRELDRSWVIPRSCQDLLGVGEGLLVNQRGRLKWKIAVLAGLWALWLESNQRIFERVEEGLKALWDRVRFWVAIWSYDVMDFKCEGLKVLWDRVRFWVAIWSYDVKDFKCFTFSDVVRN
ncbi:hypothetical protein PanWU01x14_095640 [Parasponia andersonii]|uniref:Reverse transcriptase zinc-binding domain-containing protein n=1 Tax=Parasponia andersonii TaxID=3476 RepID=A0A2P5D540_PARAD|nr:hypothetical protein PanWU01x14_095640 [Parasponia andersonii]